MDKKRSEYFACMVRDLKPVQAQVVDKRFQVTYWWLVGNKGIYSPYYFPYFLLTPSKVKEQLVLLEDDCFGSPAFQKRLSAVRNESCDYCEKYQPWSDSYDIAVTLSMQGCLNEAIDVGNFEVFKDVASLVPQELQKENQHSCAFLQRAIRVDQTGMLPGLLTIFGPNCEGCKETPLGVAAAAGNLKALDLLLNVSSLTDDEDESGRTALFRATQTCNVDAVGRLINKSDFNHGMPTKKGGKCQAQQPLQRLLQSKLAIHCWRFGSHTCPANNCLETKRRSPKLRLEPKVPAMPLHFPGA